MIFIEKQGRFGNFLFQYFFAKYLQKLTNKRIVTFTKNENIYKFNSKKNIDNIIDGYFALPKFSYFLNFWKKKSYYINDENFQKVLKDEKLQNHSIYYLNGFFHDIDFINNNIEILSNFINENKFSSKNQFIDTDLTIHIRHIHNELGTIDNHIDYKSQPDLEFYIDIINDLKPRRIKLICSKKTNKIISQLKNLYKNKILIECKDDINDFFNIVYSKNLIISNSTFSLWGSLLSNSKNIYIPNIGVLRKILKKKKLNISSNIIYI